MMLKIFDMGDGECEWWVGSGTTDEMKAAYESQVGPQEPSFVVVELSTTDLDLLTFYDDAVSPPSNRTFREQLAQLDQADLSPRLFANSA